MYGRDVRFCAETKKWLVWDGRRWNSEDTRRVKLLAKLTMREMHKQAATLEKPKSEAAEGHARRSESAKGIAAMLTCAEYEGQGPMSSAELDRAPYLLNLLNGTLDLKADRVYEHRRQDLITKLVHFDYNPHAECPQFLRFIHIDCVGNCHYYKCRMRKGAPSDQEDKRAASMGFSAEANRWPKASSTNFAAAPTPTLVLPARPPSWPPTARQPAFRPRPRLTGLGPLSITDGWQATQHIGRLSRRCKRLLLGHFKMGRWSEPWKDGKSQSFTGAGCVERFRTIPIACSCFCSRPGCRRHGAKRQSMGNENSGRWSDPGAKTTVEECDYIDMLAWSRGRQMRHECCYTGSWKWPRSRPEEVLDRTGRVINCIHYSIELLGDPYVRMCYKDPRSGGFYDYTVDLASTRANYGGLRWWFLCPVIMAGRACGRRVRKLYLAPGRRYFACWRCCDLCYTSQREDDWTRALSKAQAIRVRLGGSARMDQLFPAKPKRMRWKTYRLLRARSEESWVESLSAALGGPALAALRRA